jgi:Tat protein secretion system quality control protein TatD with DNase activity
MNVKGKKIAIVGLPHHFNNSIIERFSRMTSTTTKVFGLRREEAAFITRLLCKGEKLTPSCSTEHPQNSRAAVNDLVKMLASTIDSRVLDFRKEAKPYIERGMSVVGFNPGGWWLLGEMLTLPQTTLPLFQVLKNALQAQTQRTEYDCVIHLRTDFEEMRRYIEEKKASRLDAAEAEFLKGVMHFFDEKAQSLGPKCVTIPIELERYVHSDQESIPYSVRIESQVMGVLQDHGAYLVPLPNQTYGL